MLFFCLVLSSFSFSIYLGFQSGIGNGDAITSTFSEEVTMRSKMYIYMNCCAQKG